MLSVEKTANKLADKIAMEFGYDTNQHAIVAYGLFALLQITGSILLVYIFGQILGIPVESLIVIFSIAILRKYSGGAHASSPGMCAFIGAVVSVLFALIAINVDLSIGSVGSIGIAVFGYALYIINKLAPVDSKAKPIRKAEKRKRLKKQSILILGIYIGIVLGMLAFYAQTKAEYFIHYIVCIYLGTVWQATSLTAVGHTLLSKIDSLFNNIFISLRRKV